MKGCIEDAQTGVPAPGVDVAIEDRHVTITLPDGHFIRVEYNDVDGAEGIEENGLVVDLYHKGYGILVTIPVSQLLQAADEIVDRQGGHFFSPFFKVEKAPSPRSLRS